MQNSIPLPQIDSSLLKDLQQIKDPEIPVLSILDLGVVRKAQLNNQLLSIEITPTYSGCPANNVIQEDIINLFSKKGYEVSIKLILSPAWSTDWISQKGRDAMLAYGIAPPLHANHDKAALTTNQKIVPCTLCKSTNTKMISAFGSTACKALFQCNDCLEPFDYFKCLK